ncbi:MAG: hypothetical protein K6E40_10535, partial [Desulfovibrio sp.]|nr:hypothetical protein [Desulfovibrio sp.]
MVLAREARRERRHFPDSFADWLDECGQAALADAWRRRGTLALGQASAPKEPEEDAAYPRPGL